MSFFYFWKFIKVISKLVLTTLLPRMVAAHIMISLWFKGLRNTPLGKLLGILTIQIGIDLIKSLNLFIIGEIRDRVLTTLMFQAIHPIAPTYLSHIIVMKFHVNSYDIRGSFMEYYLFKLRKRLIEIVLCIWVCKLWNGMPEFIQNYMSTESFNVFTNLLTDH